MRFQLLAQFYLSRGYIGVSGIDCNVKINKWSSGEGATRIHVGLGGPPAQGVGRA